MVSILGLGVRVQGVENPLSTLVTIPLAFSGPPWTILCPPPSGLPYTVAPEAFRGSVVRPESVVQDLLRGTSLDTTTWPGEPDSLLVTSGLVDLLATCGWLEMEPELYLRLLQHSLEDVWLLTVEFLLDGVVWLEPCEACLPTTGVLGMDGGPQAGTAGTRSSSLDCI